MSGIASMLFKLASMVQHFMLGVPARKANFGWRVRVPLVGAWRAWRRRCRVCIREVGAWWREHDDLIAGAAVVLLSSFVMAAGLSMQSYSATLGGAPIDYTKLWDWLTSDSRIAGDPAGLLGVAAAISLPLFIAVQFQDNEQRRNRTASVLDLATIAALWLSAIVAWATLPLVFNAERYALYLPMVIGFPVICSVLVAPCAGRNAFWSGRRRDLV